MRRYTAYSSLRVVAIGRKGGKTNLEYLVLLVMLFLLLVCIVLALSKSNKD